MPRDKFAGPELQALSAVHQQIAPLIEKQISDDTQRISSLAKLNSRMFFKYEINQVFLYTARGQDLSSDEREAFIDGVHHVFQVLENLIDERVLDPQNGPPDTIEEIEYRVANIATTPSNPPSKEPSKIPILYPKLEALIKRVSSESTSSDPSTFLHLPDTIDRSKEVEKTITDVNASIIARSSMVNTHQEAHNINYQSTYHKRTTSNPRPTDIEVFRQSLLTLLSALKENISTQTCNLEHIAKLQIQYPNSSTESTNGIQLKVFLSCCSAEDKWQETACTIASQLPSSDVKFKDVRNVCKTIRNTLNEETTLDVWVRASRILRLLGPPRIIKMPPIWPTLSLEAMLVSGQSFSPYHKIVLALNLSHALLRMYHPGMQNRQWTARDIFFLFNPSEGKIYEANNPYLAHSLMETEAPKDTALANSIKFTILVYFAKILMEIALGKLLEPVDRRLDIALLEISQKGELSNNVTECYTQAVDMCLRASSKNEEDDDDDDDQGAQGGTKADGCWRCENVIFKVISTLEEARKVFNTARPNPIQDPNYAHELLIPKITQSHSTPLPLVQPYSSKNLGSQQPISLHAPIPPNHELLNDLFDDRRHHSNPGDSDKIAFTNEFFNRAKAFRENLQGDLTVRIAILDTGVDEHNPFLRGVIRRRGSSPFQEIVSFVGEPTADTFGHGTNVAALVLRIAPNTDLYVAKVSHSEQGGQASKIVEAIKWAQTKRVHIITMSFALTKEDEGISEAIRIAECNGIIIFAAASNYGGNATRSFPATLEQVLCVYASDGNGNNSDINPSPSKGRENFTTLGVAIPSITELGIYLSGTSYSTPVAAGIAANLLRFVQHLAEKKELTAGDLKEAFRRDGMKKILKVMSNPRQDYHYLVPWKELSAQAVVMRIKIALGWASR